jgi:transglutaminase-like putative cysteine protease
MRKKLLPQEIIKAKLLLPVLVLFFISCNSRIPVITSIDPKIGRMGEVITLSGTNFGSSREEAFVSIAGISPTGSSYYLWQDNMIMVRVPELGESGLVYVHARGKRSNGVLFSNSASIPRPVDGEEIGLEPRITSVNPQTGAPGALIIINGSNFGTSRAGGGGTASGVFFSWDSETPSFNPYIVKEPEFIEVSDIELGYEAWSASDIRIRLPDGARSGNIEIRTPHGSSRPVFFDVSGKPGVKNFTEKRSYTVSYSVDIRVLEATRPNTLYLWVPMPVNSPSQRNVTLVSRNIEPFIENHHGVSLFKLENLGGGASRTVNLSFSVEVYAVETQIRTMSVRRDTAPLYTTYTQSTPLIQSNNQQVINLVSTIAGKETNPHVKARVLYDWVINNIEIREIASSTSGNIATALEQKRADPYTVALLYAAMARAGGLPCIPVSGVLVDRNGQTQRHYWTEIWLNDFGWLPVDPVLGAGVGSQTFITKQDHNNYYFGNLDNQRITFSRGELILSQMENRGRLVSHTQSYSLQNIWEEAAGGLESYTSLWGDITISGIYSQ